MHSDLTLSRPDGTPITGWEEWTRPKKDYQWACERSAMELAKAWFPDSHLTAPTELMSLSFSHSRLQGLKLIRGIPEHVSSLLERGEGRNHDLWLLGRTLRESVTTCVEAKADEPFSDDTVAEYRKTALHRRERGKSARAPERIDALFDIIGKPTSNSDAVRYQLTAICATILQAKNDSSNLAVFVLHKLYTDKTTLDAGRGSSLCPHAWYRKPECQSESRTQRRRTRSPRLPSEAAQSASRDCPRARERRPCNAHPCPGLPWRTTASRLCRPNQRDRPCLAWRFVPCPFDSSHRSFPGLMNFTSCLSGTSRTTPVKGILLPVTSWWWRADECSESEVRSRPKLAS